MGLAVSHVHERRRDAASSPGRAIALHGHPRTYEIHRGYSPADLIRTGCGLPVHRVDVGLAHDAEIHGFGRRRRVVGLMDAGEEELERLAAVAAGRVAEHEEEGGVDVIGTAPPV